jgi:hypothetical protein
MLVFLKKILIKFSNPFSNRVNQVQEEEEKGEKKNPQPICHARRQPPWLAPL